jgi:hypothetical protein
LHQNTVLKTVESQPVLSLNIRNVNDLFSGFELGDFAVLHGSNSAQSLVSLLCVRAQLPPQLGGLGSDVVFIDGGNSFRPNYVDRLARRHQLDPKQTLERIYLSRAFTAYQMTALILEKLKKTIKRYNAKLVIISDIAGLFLEDDVQEDEAREVYNQIIGYLSNFAKENNIVLIATYPPHDKTERNSFLQTVTREKANVVISLNQTTYEREFILEKHPRHILGDAELPSETLTLEHFFNA